MSDNKILTLLGFARKAGRLAVGTMACEQSIVRKKAKIVLIASDISDKSRKEIKFQCEKHGTKAADLDFTIDDITRAIGTKAGIIAVQDDGFAGAIAEKL